MQVGEKLTGGEGKRGYTDTVFLEINTVRPLNPQPDKCLNENLSVTACKSKNWKQSLPVQQGP